VREALKQKKEAFWAWLSQGSHEAADRHRMAKRSVVYVVAEAKTRAWEEFCEAMDKDFQLASSMF